MFSKRDVDIFNVETSQPVFRDIAITLGILAVLIGGFFLWVLLRPESPNLTSESFWMDSPPEEDPLMETPSMMEIEPERYVIKQHVVVAGESFSLITGRYWNDIFLWPDLYIRNKMNSPDPDLIFPQEIIDIYNRLGSQDSYEPIERKVILDAYIKVYDIYKSLGPEKNGSAWTLLWCGTKYDRNFLEMYAHRIAPEDMAVAKRYIAEEGFLD